MEIQTKKKSYFYHNVPLALLGFALAGTALLFTLGCSKVTATVPPGTDLGKLKSFYVVRHDKDGRGLNELIRSDLATRGVTATTGAESARPQIVDAIVTYEDRWGWDVTMFLVSLTVTVRDGSTNVLLASGQSFRSSGLARAEPREMVKEAFDAIFKSGK